MILPSGWRTSTLGEVATWGSGGTPRATNRHYYSGTIPWAVIGDLNDGTVVRTKSAITKAALAESSAKMVSPGTLLVAMYGSIGKLGVAGCAMATNQAIAFAVANTDLIETKYLYWWLRYQRPLLQQAGKGATQLNISQQVLRAWPIVFPPADQQRRIVEAIESLVTAIDITISTLQTAHLRIDAYRRSLRETLLSSAGGTIERLGHVLRSPLANGRSVPDAAVGGAAFPVLRLTALKSGRVDMTEYKLGAWSYEQARPLLVRAGDWLVARGNGSIRLVGRGGLIENDEEIAFPDTMIRIRPDSSRLLPEFLALFWDSAAARRYLQGRAKTTAGIHKVNQKDLEQMEVPVPNLADQAQAVTTFGVAAESATRLEGTVVNALLRANRLRRAVLATAFTGRLGAASGEVHLRDVPSEAAAVLSI